MNPIKLIAAALILLGLLFRGISLAYFRAHEPDSRASEITRRRFEQSRRRAFRIDMTFLLAGLWVLVAR